MRSPDVNVGHGSPDVRRPNAGVHHTLQASSCREGRVQPWEVTQSLSQHLHTREGAGQQGACAPG